MPSGKKKPLPKKTSKPRKRKRLPAHRWKIPKGLSPSEREAWKSAKEWQKTVDREKKLTKAEALDRAASFSPLRTGSRGYQVGAKTRKVRAVVGAQYYDAAEMRYGNDFMAVAVAKLDASFKRTHEARKERIKKRITKLEEHGYTPEEVERYVAAPIRQAYRRLSVPVRPIKKGKYAGQKMVRILRKGKVVKPWFRMKDERAVLTLKSQIMRRDRAGELATHLDISLTEARRVIKETEDAAEIKYQKYLRSPEYKWLKREYPRKAAGMTLTRFRGGAVAALYTMANLEGYD